MIHSFTFILKILENAEYFEQKFVFKNKYAFEKIFHLKMKSSLFLEEYRTAMTYSAYATLICPDNKKKVKYVDMWLNSKQNYSDDNQNLNLLKCLEDDVDFIMEHGIKINLSDFNLNDICVRDITSCAFDSKVDNIPYIQKILNELESMNNHVTDFAKGTILLCIHAIQFSERNFIFDNITSAISKLNGVKSKSILEKYLLTNLQLFEMIEKLFARGTSISKQVEDEKFKLKNFKVNDEQPIEEESNRIISTFAGIGMSEDRKSLKDLEKFISDWEKYLKNNFVSFH